MLGQNTDLSVNLKVIDDSLINVTVKNVSDKMIRAYSHVETYERHYDYIEIHCITPDHEEFVISLIDSRDKSAPVIVELKPGESFSHTINLIRWSERSVNKASLEKEGFNHFPRGIKIRAKYRNSACDNCSEYYKSIWTGYVFSEWVDF